MLELIQSYMYHLSFSYLLGRSLTVFFKRDFSFRVHSSLVLYDGLPLGITMILGQFTALGYLRTMFTLAALLYSSFRSKDDELIKTLATSISIYIVLYVNWDEKSFDCITLALATTQFLRKPDGLKESLREIRIIFGPIYVISMCSGMRFHSSIDVLAWDIPSLATMLAVASSIGAAVFFRPDNNQTLKLLLSEARIPSTVVRRRTHGYLMSIGFLVTFVKVLLNSQKLVVPDGALVSAVCFGVLNTVLYLTYKISRRWR